MAKKSGNKGDNTEITAGVKITTLDNGLRVVTHSDPNAPTVSVGISARVGQRNEDTPDSGLSHFLEHMFFTGTSEHSEDEISDIVADKGMATNAFTSGEETSYYMNGRPDKLEDAIDLLSEILLKANFPEDKLKRERGVILQEIAMYKDDIGSQAYTALKKAAYGDQIAAGSTLGPAENVENFSREDLIRHMKKYYCGSNMVISAAGKIDHNAFVDMVKSRFSSIEKGVEKKPPQPVFKGGYHHIDHPSEQVNIYFALPGIKDNTKGLRAYELAADILGGDMSSRLFKTIRNELGAVYAIGSQYITNSDDGMMIVFAGTTPDKAQMVVDRVILEMRKAVDSMTQEELNRAKAQYEYMIAAGTETSSAKRKLAAKRTLLFGEPKLIEDLEKEVQAVTLADVKAALVDMMTGNIALATAGPKVEFAPIEDMQKRLSKGLKPKGGAPKP